MITINVRGSTKRIEGFLRRNQKIYNLNTKRAIVEEDGKTSIIWTNSNVVKGQNIAVILNYGHGTRNGGYVVGRNYIEPALAPVFDEIAAKAWQEVTET